MFLALRYGSMACFLTVSMSLLARSTHDSTEEKLKKMIAPVKCTRGGIRAFFKLTYNDPLYGTRFLPVCYAHVIDMLEYAKRTKQSPAFITQVLHAFDQKLSESTWVNPHAFVFCLKGALELCPPIFRAHEEGGAYRMRSVLERNLLEKFDLLQADPDAFLDAAAKELYTVDHGAADEVMHARYAFASFVERALDKLIWDPGENEEVWKSWKLCGKILQDCFEAGLFPSPQVYNRCLWTLCTRLSYCLSCGGAGFNASLYRLIKEDLEEDMISFLAYPELEVLMTTKQEFLLRSVYKGFARSMAREEGFVVD